MLDQKALYELMFDSLQKIIFPEVWLKLDKELAKQDLITLILIERMGECTMTQIAERMNFPLSTTTGIVDRLVRKGYARRIRSESDRRMVLIEASELGRQTTSDLMGRVTELLGKVTTLFDEQEQAVLLKLLSKLGDLLGSVETGAPNLEAQDNKSKIQKINIE